MHGQAQSGSHGRASGAECGMCTDGEKERENGACVWIR